MESDIKAKYFDTTSETDSFGDLSIKGRLFFRGILASKELNPSKSGTVRTDGELILKGVNEAQDDFGDEVTRVKFYFDKVQSYGSDYFVHFFDQDGYLEFENGLSLGEANTTGSIFGDLKIVVFYTGAG